MTLLALVCPCLMFGLELLFLSGCLITCCLTSEELRLRSWLVQRRVWECEAARTSHGYSRYRMGQPCMGVRPDCSYSIQEVVE